MFLLHCVFNIPRMRMSLSQRRLLLWLLRECGVKDVPSLRAYHELEQQLRRQVGVPTSLHKSDLGNLFYSNSILALVCTVNQTFCLSSLYSTDQFRFVRTCLIQTCHGTSPYIPMNQNDRLQTFSKPSTLKIHQEASSHPCIIQTARISSWTSCVVFGTSGSLSQKSGSHVTVMCMHGALCYPITLLHGYVF